jgi:aminopeptidase
MITDIELEKYSALVLGVGLNLQKGQELVIYSPIETAFVARAMTKKAYEMGASLVRVNYSDETLIRLNYEYAEVSALERVPKWFVDMKLDKLKQNACYVVIDAENPELLSGIDKDKLMRVSVAKGKAMKKYSDAIMKNQIRWCVASMPTESWAKKIFPNDNNAMEKLWNLIKLTMRLDTDDPVQAWRNHVDRLNARSKFLNDSNFEYLRFTSANGTDIKVGLAINHKWTAAEEKSADGVSFIANLPTEEVFTAPHKFKTEGVLKSALPLVSDGNVIDNFTLVFKKGKIVKYSAEKGFDALKNLIEADNGSHYLGEVALIGKNSPIAESKTLFFNTLFDENASCHLAIGKAYPTTVFDGENLSKKELTALGLNDSIVHADFMIGTPDISVTGITFDGKEVPLFTDGEWCI